MKTTVIAITGPSGFRKGELVEKAIQSSDEFVRAISYTDRPKLEHEIDGNEFHFVSEDEFSRMVDAEKFVEWQRLVSNNHRYGKTKEEFERTVNDNPGKVIFTVVNVINLPVFKRSYPEIKSIFVDVKDTKSLIDYLRASPDVTSEEEFEKRLKFATEERRRRHLTDYTMNMKDSLEESYEEFIKLVELCRKSD